MANERACKNHADEFIRLMNCGKTGSNTRDLNTSRDSIGNIRSNSSSNGGEKKVHFDEKHVHFAPEPKSVKFREE